MDISNLMPLCEAIKLATGLKVHLATALRWSVNGRHGCRLQTWVIGGRRYTTPEAVKEFVSQTTAATTPAINAAPPKASTPNQRAKAIKRAEAICKDHGI